jgi:nicotinamidase-related amidase
MTAMLTPENTALVLLDVQGKLTSLMAQDEQLIRNLRILIQGARILQLPIHWMEQYPAGLGPTTPEVAELLEDLAPIPKLSFSACAEEAFRNRLKSGRRLQILLCGIETHVCVYQTARDLLEHGYEVELVVDATSSRTLENKKIGVKKMTATGVRITSVETALFELLRTSRSPQFKQISRLVR